MNLEFAEVDMSNEEKYVQIKNSSTKKIACL